MDIKIIGTSHISKDSINEIKGYIDDEKPDIVAVELDKARLIDLMKKKKERLRLSNIFRVGISGFFFALVGSFAQKKLGEIVGIRPGSDMKTAVVEARKNKAQLALIDQPIQITLKRFSQEFGFREKWNMATDFFFALFRKDKLIRFDIRKVPSDKVIKELLSEVKRKYPNIYRVLVEERNIYMANNLKKLSQDNPDKKIFAVVGAGHVEGMKEILDSPSYGFSFSVDY